MYTARSFSMDRDLAAVTVLLNTCDAAFDLDDNYSEDDLRLEFSEPRLDKERDMRLWEDASGRLVGFGQVWNPETVEGNETHDCFAYIRVHPEADQSLYDAMLGWAEQRTRDIAGQVGKRPLMRAGAKRGYRQAEDALVRNGYAPTRYFFSMVRDLNQPIPEPVYPAGYTLTHAHNDDDIIAWIDVFNNSFIDHWNHHPATVEDHLHWCKNDPHYRYELDTRAVAPDGTLAGFCFMAINPESNERNNELVGSINVLGTRRGHRKIGLGKALLLSGMQTLRDAGMQTAKLGVDAENPSGALGLYEANGFTVDMERVSYLKEL